MTTATASPARDRSITFLDIIIGVELFLLIVMVARTYTFLPFLTFTILSWTTLLLSLAFLPFALTRLPYAGFALIAMFAIIFGYQYWFASVWHTRFTGALIGSYQPLFLTPMAAILSVRFPASRFLRIFFIAAIVHLFIYIFLYQTLDANMIRHLATSGQEALQGQLRRTHDAAASGSYSDFKIATSDSAMAFVVLYSISHLYGQRSLWARAGMAALAALSVYGLIVSDSRWNTAATVAGLLMLAIPMGSRVRAWLGFAIAAAGIAMVIIAASLPFNPFSLMASDSSGIARALQFDTANPVFWQTPILGIGLPNQANDLDSVFTDTVYVADLGYFGDMLGTGFVGILLILLAFWYMARFTGDLSAGEANQRAARFLSAFLIYLAIEQIFSPQLTVGLGGVFLSLSLAYIGRRSAVVPRQDDPRRRDQEDRQRPAHGDARARIAGQHDAENANAGHSPRS
ncbi:O-antigen ligase family protein [Novosphingobium sp. B-7]|uniref:O-antigen ligase family protein n=1 Tax=Novosphingobium sp. B-7 TaxID=1298855 RepID=UPI0003B7B3E6